MPKPLPPDIFALIVRHTLLLSVDLIVWNHYHNQVLLGWRLNEPARKTWFVPGCVVLKNESILDAVFRLIHQELGIDINRAPVCNKISQPVFLRMSEHRYPTNFTGTGNFGTHYVALAHEVRLRGPLEFKADSQHGELRWFSVEELLGNNQVHEFTKNLFR